MHAATLATLRAIFPRVTLHPPRQTSLRELELGAIISVDVKGGALIVTVDQGVELHFQVSAEAWRVLSEHLQSGNLSFDDPERGLRRVAEILGTDREHLDA